MADNNFAGVIESLMKGMNTVLSTKTVVGEATQFSLRIPWITES